MERAGTIGRVAIAAAALFAAGAAGAQARVQTPHEAFVQDAAEYAARFDTAPYEAVRRLYAQEASVAATDAIRAEFADRLAGIAIDHVPDFRIVVLLTGEAAVAPRTIAAGDLLVPVEFRTGAAATRAQVAAAMRDHGAALRALLPRGMGMGHDQRSGRLVIMIRDGDARRQDMAALRRRLEALTGVPVRLATSERRDADAAVRGGARVTGIEPDSGRRQACTTGFVVTDGTRTGLITAAHCPDMLDYVAPDGRRVPLAFAGKWGARHQDVQLMLSEEAQEPLFYADSAKQLLRPLTSWRTRDSTRAGDLVCRRGETTGYSCSEVELTDYAPGGELCGGPCDPSWITVAGPSCKGGDSGGPIFLGTVAFGIVKGSNYRADRSCLFSFYMSTDFLPEGWRLLHQ
ncbi:MAG: hypothetical protein ACK4K7_03335 [Allosphingosinicella sp.]|uniref:hypothetical protein n=1 Tax=Allosphingosinicella sp. TaxID=2823234 RepID=UPI00395A6A27